MSYSQEAVAEVANSPIGNAGDEGADATIVWRAFLSGATDHCVN